MDYLKVKERVNFTPSKVKAGDVLNFKIPKLTRNDVIAPDSLKLLFEYHQSDTDKYTDYLSAYIIKRLEVKIGSNTVYDVDNYDRYKIQKDYWLPKYKKGCMLMEGVQSEDLYKFRQGIRSADQTEVTQSELAFSAAPVGAEFNKYNINLDFDLFQDFFCPQSLEDDVIINIHLKSGGYELKNISLCYEKINDEQLANDLYERMNNYTLDYEHVKFFKNISGVAGVDKNVEINSKFNSLKAIFMVDKKNLNSENFSKQILDPKTSLYVNIDGVSNRLFPNGMIQNEGWVEAFKYFTGGDYLVELDINQKTYYTRKHFLVVNFYGIEIKKNIQLRYKAYSLLNDGVANDTLLFTVANAKVNFVDGRFSQLVV